MSENSRWLLDDLGDLVRMTPGLEFGYIGNIYWGPYYDDRCFYIKGPGYKPYPHRIEDSLWRCESIEMNQDEFDRAKRIVEAYRLTSGDDPGSSVH